MPYCGGSETGLIILLVEVYASSSRCSLSPIYSGDSTPKLKRQPDSSNRYFFAFFALIKSGRKKKEKISAVSAVVFYRTTSL
jgi:hypothetical protein